MPRSVPQYVQSAVMISVLLVRLSLSFRLVQTSPVRSGWIYLKRGMTESALQIFRVLVLEYPDNPTYRYHLGATLLNSGEKAQGRNELEAALARAPSADEQQAIRMLLADRANS